LGLVGEKNATGDAQKKLDVFSNQTVIEAFSNTGLVAALVSEELDQPQYLGCSNSTPYILCIDPLDGSSNIDSAGALGTIFGVYRRVTQEGCCNLEHDLQAGGKATTGSQRVLDIQAASIHQRSPLVIGSMALVELYEQFLQSDRLT
jgi:fructose-1,6-bisphosphatase I